MEGLEDGIVSNALSDVEKQEWKQEMNEAFRAGANSSAEKAHRFPPMTLTMPFEAM